MKCPKGSIKGAKGLPQRWPNGPSDSLALRDATRGGPKSTEKRREVGNRSGRDEGAILCSEVLSEKKNDPDPGH